MVTATILIDFNGADGERPLDTVIDAAGDLFGTTRQGGANGHGTVFEIAYSPISGYASVPVTLLSYTGNFADVGGAYGQLAADSSGNLFEITVDGLVGTLYELPVTPSGYASTPSRIATFAGEGATGVYPGTGLAVDASGDLIGEVGNVTGTETAFFKVNETAKGNGSALNPPGFGSGVGNSNPYGDLTSDAQGDLFGTVLSGSSGGWLGL